MCDGAGDFFERPVVYQDGDQSGLVCLVKVAQPCPLERRRAKMTLPPSAPTTRSATCTGGQCRECSERGQASDGEKMGKGVRLSREELLAVKESLNKIEL